MSFSGAVENNELQIHFSRAQITSLIRNMKALGKNERSPNRKPFSWNWWDIQVSHPLSFQRASFVSFTCIDAARGSFGLRSINFCNASIRQTFHHTSKPTIAAMTIARRPVSRVSQLTREGEEWKCGQGEGVIVEVAGVEEDMVDEAASREEERWLKSMGTFMERSFIALDSIEIFVFSEVQLSVLKEERKKGGKNRQRVHKIGLSQFAAVIG